MKNLEDKSLMNPPMQKLLDKIPQKYEAVLAVTRRAKQIIREQRLNPAAFTEEELKRKPLSIALDDIIDGNVDQEALMAPDLAADELETRPETLFIENEAYPAKSKAAEPEPVVPVVDADIDDLPEVDDLFNLGTDKDD